MNLNEVVRGMEPLVQRLAGADVRLDVRLAVALSGTVRMDPAQLEHVVVNLILNARDAMPAGGRPHVETSERRISGLSRGRPVRPGRYVVLAVGDSGTGLDESAARGRGGEPRRRGLGRSIVFGIVRQYGGVVGCRASRARARSVKVYLPRLDDEPDGLEPDAIARSRCADRRRCWWPRMRTACASCCGRC